MKLLLVRHSITLAAEKNQNAGGGYDVGLSEKGIQLCYENREKVKFPETDYYFSSGMLRSNQTFEILYPKQTMAFLPEFKEHFMGEYEGSDRSNEYLKNGDWLHNRACHNEENFCDFSNRILNALRNLFEKYPENTITLVAHSGVIRAIYMYAFNLDISVYRKIDAKNAMGYWFDIQNENDKLIVSYLGAVDGSEIMEE